MIDPTTLVRLCRARDLLADRYAEPVRLEEAAAEAYLSPFHFHRLFRRTFGETPLGFVTRRRMEAAKALLAGGASVTEACFGTGYSSLGSFSARFRDRVGCPPSEYRAQARRLVAVPGLWLPRPIPECYRRMFFGLAA